MITDLPVGTKFLMMVDGTETMAEVKKLITVEYKGTLSELAQIEYIHNGEYKLWKVDIKAVITQLANFGCYYL